MTNEDLKRLYDTNHVSQMNKDFVRYDTQGNIKVSDNPSNKDAINKDTAEQIAAKINSVKIRNVASDPTIYATDSTVQAVATKYIQDNYSREPEELDGLFITFTDHDNDVVEYDYFNGFWQDTGRNGVDLSGYASLTEENSYSGKQNFNAETEFNATAEHNADVNVNDSTMNVTDTTSDTVTKYGADKIIVNDKEIMLPSEAGVIALASQIDIPLIVGTDDNPIEFYKLKKEKYYYVQGKFKISNIYGKPELLNIDSKILVKWIYDYNGGWGVLHPDRCALVLFNCRAVFSLEYPEIPFSISYVAGAMSKAYFLGSLSTGDRLYRISTIYDGGQEPSATPKSNSLEYRTTLLSLGQFDWQSYSIGTYLPSYYAKAIYKLSGYAKVKSSEIWKFPSAPFLTVKYYSVSDKRVLEFLDAKLKESYDKSKNECALECCAGSTVKYILDDSGYITLATAEDGVGEVGNASITNINGKTAADGYDFWTNANSFYAPITSGTSGQVLQSNGEGTAPTWTDNPASSLKDTTEQIVDANSNFYAAGATKTENDKYSIVAGDQAKSNGIGNVVIGPSAMNTLNTNNNVIAGGYATSSANETVTAGHNARTEADGAIQLGEGINNVANSFQVKTDNIYKVSSHTLTVKNAQIDGNDSYGLIKGTGSPSALTEGKVGQEYQDTTSERRFYCTSADSGVYVWKEIQEKITQSATTVADDVNTIVFGNVLMQSKTFSMTGNSEQVFSFPVTYTKLLAAWCNSAADGQSANNSSAVIDSNTDNMTVRICGADSTVTMFAIGFKE